MNTSKYSPEERKNMKRVMRHPAYVALQKRAKAMQEQLDEYRREPLVKQLEAKLKATLAELEAARDNLLEPPVAL